MIISRLWRILFWGGLGLVFGSMALANWLSKQTFLGILNIVLAITAFFFVFQSTAYYAITKKRKSPLLIESLLNLAWLFILIRWLSVYGKFEKIYWAIDSYYWSISVLYLGVFAALLSVILLVGRWFGKE